MLPPWKKYPQIPRGSIGWRMGYGEDYASEFYKWFKELSNEAVAAFAMDNPEPEDWGDYYARLRSQA